MPASGKMTHPPGHAWLPGEVSTGSRTDYVRGFLGGEDIGVDHEVVVRGGFAVDSVEAFEVVATACVGFLDLARRLGFVKRILRADALGSSPLGCRYEHTQLRRVGLDRVGGGVGDYDHSAARRRLHDRLADQGPDLCGPYALQSRRGARAERPGISASLCEHLENATSERSSALFVCDVPGL